jgi:hypothetical protein
MIVVREKNTSVLTCTFKDETGAPVTPTAATYQIDDESGTSIKAETAFTPPDITITANENRILSSPKPSERRIVTVKWTYGTDKNGADEYEYLVKNLSKVS